MVSESCGVHGYMDTGYMYTTPTGLDHVSTSTPSVRYASTSQPCKWNAAALSSEMLTDDGPVCFLFHLHFLFHSRHLLQIFLSSALTSSCPSVNPKMMPPPSRPRRRSHTILTHLPPSSQPSQLLSPYHPHPTHLTAESSSLYTHPHTHSPYLPQSPSPPQSPYPRRSPDPSQMPLPMALTRSNPPMGIREDRSHTPHVADSYRPSPYSHSSPATQVPRSAAEIMMQEAQDRDMQPKLSVGGRIMAALAGTFPVPLYPPSFPIVLFRW